MKFLRVRSILPDWKNALAALASAILLIGAFPDFEFWFLAWFALVPLLWAVEREKGSVAKSFVLGWIFGTVFFFGTCWWLTFAPITYAGFPQVVAYLLMFGVCLIVGVFPCIFASVLSILLKRFGSIAILAAPFVWVFTEFLRYWLTGNNWNALGYSQAFGGIGLLFANLGGVYIVSLLILCSNSIFAFVLFRARDPKVAQNISLVDPVGRSDRRLAFYYGLIWFMGIVAFILLNEATENRSPSNQFGRKGTDAFVVAVQPNVPMSELTYEKWQQLRKNHVELARLAFETNLPKFVEDQTAYSKPGEAASDRLLFDQFTRDRFATKPRVVIFPESPMNFMYEDDPETQEFINSFAARNNVSVLFNSAEPDSRNGKFFNSAVMVGPEGKEIGQYDKIYLVPFGESVPAPLQNIVPAFVGSFSYGNEYDLFPLGDAKAGVMICFESHFGQLSREFVRNGADVIIEMTNDGYLGPTPVLRQHLANAVFRAVETNRPVLRVTNVGITAYINERGEVLDPAASYVEDTRVWSVSKSDGRQTFYVKYGDWFAWLCSIVTIGLLIFAVATRRRDLSVPPA
jgi:apolipoprotein N-acyltransferase